MSDTTGKGADAFQSLAAVGQLLSFFPIRNIDINKEIAFDFTGRALQDRAAMFDGNRFSFSSGQIQFARPRVPILGLSQDVRQQLGFDSIEQRVCILTQDLFGTPAEQGMCRLIPV